jgi:hypothetical protein
MQLSDHQQTIKRIGDYLLPNYHRIGEALLGVIGEAESRGFPFEAIVKFEIGSVQEMDGWKDQHNSRDYMFWDGDQ